MLHNTKRIFTVAILTICLLLVFFGCAQTTTDTNPTIDVTTPYTYTSVWPDNEYTETIFPPEGATVVSVRDFSSSGRYEIHLTDIARDAADAYVQQLIDSGFASVADSKNDVSAGVLLQKGNTTLSIAYSGENLTLLITLAGETGTEQ